MQNWDRDDTILFGLGFGCLIASVLVLGHALATGSDGSVLWTILFFVGAMVFLYYAVDRKWGSEAAVQTVFRLAAVACLTVIVMIGIAVGRAIANPNPMKDHQAKLGKDYPLSERDCVWVAVAGAAWVSDPDGDTLVLAVQGSGWNADTFDARLTNPDQRLERARVPSMPTFRDPRDRSTWIAFRVPTGVDEVEVVYPYKIRIRSVGTTRDHRLIWRIARDDVPDRSDPPPAVNFPCRAM